MWVVSQEVAKKKIIEGCQKNNLLLPLFFQERHEMLFGSLLCEELGFLSWKIQTNYILLFQIKFSLSPALFQLENIYPELWTTGGGKRAIGWIVVILNYIICFYGISSDWIIYIFFYGMSSDYIVVLWNVVRLYCLFNGMSSDYIVCFMECPQII